MKKPPLQLKRGALWAFTCAFLLVTNVSAQLTGIKTIPGTYASVSAAITALNASGVGAGGVTFNITAGYTETITSTLSVTATGTVANPIVFQKSGAGANPVITSYVGGTATPLSLSWDGIWNLVGSDYVTIDGINITENGANTSNPSTMEYGFALYKNGPKDGCQNNTIKNCIITLNRFNNAAPVTGPGFVGSNGIIVMNSTATDALTNIVVSAASGGSSNNKFYSNTIQNCNNAIAMTGFAAPPPFTFADQNNDIGGSSALTGNTLINFGGAPFAVNVAGAVFVKDQWNFNVSYNTIHNNNGSGVNHANILRGIWANVSSNGASATINNNTITLNGGGANTQLTAIENSAGGSGQAGNTISISNNTITNCTYNAATSGVFYGIYNTSNPENLIIRNNTFTNNSSAANSGSFFLIYNTGAVIYSAIINKNTITNATLTAPFTSAAFRAIMSTGAGTLSTYNIDSNSIESMGLSGTGSGEFGGLYTTGTAQQLTMRNNSITNMTLNTTGTTYGIYANYTLPTTGTLRTKIVSNNVISNINRTGQGGTVYGYYSNSLSVAAGNIITVNNNTVSGLSVAGTTVLNPIFEGDGTTASPYGPTKIVTGNSVTNINAGYGAIVALTVQYSNLNLVGTGSNNIVNNIISAGAITGLASLQGSQNFFSNTFNNMISSGVGSAVLGISVTGGLGTYNIYNNKIYDLASTVSGTVSGVNITGAATNTIYNNLIGDLRAPATSSANAVNGINVSGGTTDNIYNNTVYLNASSTGTNFGTSALNVTAGPTTVVVRNNMLINNSIANGTGLIVAHRRASTTITNFSATSDRNLYYAGTPGTANLLYYDGTNSIQTISAYITLVGPTRDSLAFSENVTLLSTIGSNGNFLKPNTTIPTGIESAGIIIPAVTIDNSGAARPGNPAYAGMGGLPDIGAIEDNYTGMGIAMTHDSSNADQVTGVLPPGSTDVQILKIRVYGKNGVSALDATSFKFTTTGTTTPANILNAKLYSTGNSPVFANTLQYGSTVNSPSGVFYFTGTKKIADGVNYFWLLYNVSASATPGNTLDATLDSIRMSGTNYALINNDPLGSRQIKGRLSGNYDVGVGKTAPDYASINAAMSDLAVLGVSGPVTFTLTDPTYNITTTNITAVPIVVNAYENASATNTVTLRPASGVTAVINESFAGTTFNLSGVNYFRIDGRQGGSGTPKSLTIQNDNTTGSALTFINDASNNRLQYAVFKGASNASANGVINFSTGIVNGNDFNTIDNCDIADAATTPATLIQSLGSIDGTVGKFNDNNVVSNCNMYNFWHTTAESNAFKISNGNNYWTITGNSIYQTVSRASSAGYYIFNLNGGNALALNGVTITNNYIGGSAPLCGGTPWTQTSSAANQNTYFNMGSYVTSRYSNNTMANYAFTTTSTSATGSGLLSFAQFINGRLNVDSNTIGSMTDSNSIVITGGSAGAFVPIYMAGSNTAGTYSVSNNKFGGIKVNGGGTNSNSITAIFIPTGAGNNINYTISGNVIGNPISNNIIAWPSTAGTAIVRGIVNQSNANAFITSNQIHNLTNLNTGTGAAQVIGINCTAGINTITSNIIDSLTNVSAQTGSGANASVVGISLASTAGSGTVSQNTIYALQNTHPAAAVHVNGIHYGGGVGDIISRNFIHSLTTASSSVTSQINGMVMTGGTGSIVNNMVRLGINEAGTSLILTPVINGLSKTGGNLEAYFNTIYIGGTGVGSTLGNSYAFNRSAAGTDAVQNNVFVNNRSNSTTTGGSHFVVALNNTTTINLNYNIYHSSGTGDTVGIITGGAGAHTLVAWKTLSGLDATTGSGSPGLINPTAGVGSLNLHVSGTTPVEGQGVVLTGAGTDVDYDGQTRSGQTPVDIGADGGLFTAADLTPANIVYTQLANTQLTTNRVISATITDATGIFLTPTFSPRIYFKKMVAGSWNSSPGVYVSGTKTNSVWNFTITSATMSGVAANDTVFYYIIAQDSATSNNVGSVPSGADASTVSSVTTHPAQPYFYKISPQISGPINVGAGQTYTSLTGTNGLFNFINSGVVSGNITVNITSDIQEPGTVALNPTVETGVGNYTIRVVPDAAIERILYGTVGAGMIRINGADRVTFDGRFAGSGRYLKFVDTSTTGSTIALMNDAHRDTFMYCTILGNNTSTGDFLFGPCTIGSGNDSNGLMYCKLNSINRSTLVTNTNISSANASAGTENSENTIAYNEIVGSRYGGINLNAGSTGNNWMIYNNYFYLDSVSIANPTGADHWIIYIQGGGGHTIRKNSIGGSATDRSGLPYTITSAARSVYPIYVNSNSPFPITVDSNNIGNMTIIATTTGLYGIYTTTAITNINNNTIGNIVNPADSMFTAISANLYGIYVASGTANVSGNTIANYYNRGGAALISAGIYLAGGISTVSKNICHDIFSLSTSTTNYTQAPAGIVMTSGSHLVDNNTIYNISNLSTAATAYLAVGISCTGGTNPTISRNRIYNISALGTGTGTSSPQVYGIFNSGTSHLFRYNQVAMGNNTTGETRVFGAQDASTGGTNRFYYNSIFVGGNTSAGANNSYAIQRTATASNVLTWNNIFYNKRTTGGTGTNYASGTNSAAGITTTTSNYNLYVVNDTAKVTEFGSGAPFGAWSYNNFLYLPYTYNTNWIETTANLRADSLFTDTAIANLNTMATRTQSWYVNGKGCALADQSGDFNNNSGVRSVTISAGATDIGSVELTPGVGLLPPSATADKIPNYNDSTSYYFGARTIAKVKWGSTGTLPTSLDVKYYSGVNPSNGLPGTTSTNAYWNMVPTGGSGYSTTLSLLQDSAMYGTVNTAANMRIVRYVGPTTQWSPLYATAVDNLAGTMTAPAVTAFGVFAGTNAANKPLPVEVLSFNATAMKDDVMLNWITASESNSEGFGIERSTDGKTFERIDFVKSEGNSNRTLDYTYTDNNAFNSSNVLYYRLRLQDNDGKYSYSDVVSVSRDNKAVDALSLFPNPFVDQFTLKLVAAEDASATITVVDIAGKVVMELNKSLVKGNNQLSIDAKALNAGIYFMQLNVNGEKEVMKIIKQ
ncbi:MAG: T9SS type A sorting domain-containing protein [Bacteroidota bacterium]